MLAVVGFFAFVCIYVTGLSGGMGGGGATGVSPEAGEKIYWGDGQCHTCHSIGTSGSATRGPNQEGLASRAEERAKETGLSSGLEYMVESIVNPSSHVAEVKLYNIDPDAQYMVSITGETYTQSPWKTMSGKKLIQPEVIIREKPGSALLRYRLIK